MELKAAISMHILILTQRRKVAKTHFIN